MRFRVALMTMLVLLLVAPLYSQTGSYERSFPQSKATIEKTLKSLQASLAGHLPVLEGFAQPGERPLDLYQRGYYQTTVQISSDPFRRIGGARQRKSDGLVRLIQPPPTPDISC